MSRRDSSPRSFNRNYALLFNKHTVETLTGTNIYQSRHDKLEPGFLTNQGMVYELENNNNDRNNKKRRKEDNIRRRRSKKLKHMDQGAGDTDTGLDVEQHLNEEDLHEDLEEHLEQHTDSSFEELEPSWTPDGVYWSASEKEKFFVYLGRRSRHDLVGITREIGTKTLAEVEEYHKWLFNAANDPTIEPIGIWDIPAAREMSTEWLVMEENQATSIVLQDEESHGNEFYPEHLRQLEEKEDPELDEMNPDYQAAYRTQFYGREYDVPSALEFDTRLIVDPPGEHFTLLKARRLVRLSRSLYYNAPLDDDNNSDKEFKGRARPNLITGVLVKELDQILVDITRLIIRRAFQVRWTKGFGMATTIGVTLHDMLYAIHSLGLDILTVKDNMFWKRSLDRLGLQLLSDRNEPISTEILVDSKAENSKLIDPEEDSVKFKPEPVIIERPDELSVDAPNPQDEWTDDDWEKGKENEDLEADSDMDSGSDSSSINRDYGYKALIRAIEKDTLPEDLEEQLVFQETELLETYDMKESRKEEEFLKAWLLTEGAATADESEHEYIVRGIKRFHNEDPYGVAFEYLDSERDEEEEREAANGHASDKESSDNSDLEDDHKNDNKDNQHHNIDPTILASDILSQAQLSSEAESGEVDSVKEEKEYVFDDKVLEKFMSTYSNSGYSVDT